MIYLKNNKYKMIKKKIKLSYKYVVQKFFKLLYGPIFISKEKKFLLKKKIIKN